MRIDLYVNVCYVIFRQCLCNLKIEYNYSYLCMAHTFFWNFLKVFFFTRLSPKSYWIPILFFKIQTSGDCSAGLSCWWAEPGWIERSEPATFGRPCVWVMCFLCFLVNFSLKNSGFDGFSLRILAYFVKKVDKPQKMALIAFATETLAAPVRVICLECLRQRHVCAGGRIISVPR